MNQEVGLLKISKSAFWRSEHGKRSRGENWTDNRLQKVWKTTWVNQKTWPKTVPPMFQGSRARYWFQEDELRRNKDAIGSVK